MGNHGCMHGYLFPFYRTLLPGRRENSRYHNWDMLYLGATLNEKLERFSPHLFRLKKAWTTHAMIFNNQNGVIDYILNNNGGGRKIDVFYAEQIQEKLMLTSLCMYTGFNI